jgi:hypothetical protein
VTSRLNVVEPGKAALPAIELTQLRASGIDAHYRLTTPANTPFQFELVTWQANDHNYAEIVVDHVSDRGVSVGNDPLSLASASSWQRLEVVCRLHNATASGSKGPSVQHRASIRHRCNRLILRQRAAIKRHCHIL